MRQHKYHGTPISQHCHVFPASQQQTRMQQLENGWKYCCPGSFIRIYRGYYTLRVILVQWSSEGPRRGVKCRKVLKLAAAAAAAVVVVVAVAVVVMVVMAAAVIVVVV